LVNLLTSLSLVSITAASYPKIEFYHTDGVRTMMVDILFIYAKLKPETSYRQVPVNQGSEHAVSHCLVQFRSCLFHHNFFV